MQNLPIIQAWFDGCCEPINPGGNMGIGVKILNEAGQLMHEHSHFVAAGEDNSNNVAEYMGFEWILDKLLQDGHNEKCIIIRGDSKMVIAQMYGVSGKKWKIKEGRYVPYANRCKEKLAKFVNVTCEWIPRDQNFHADELSKKQLKQHGIVFEIQPTATL